MTKIKDLPKLDMPREKLRRYGVQKLADHELLALLLGSGIKGLNVLELSRKILQTIRKIGIEKISFKNLESIKGLGSAKAGQLIAVLELTRRLKNTEKVEILSPKEIWKLCSDIRDSKKEHFLTFYLDTQQRLIERRIISIGTLSASLVHPREVFEPGVTLSAASIIVAHNHPSGSLEASEEDIQVTKRLIEAGELLGIPLVDHVIVTENSFKSFIKEI